MTMREKIALAICLEVQCREFGRFADIGSGDFVMTAAQMSYDPVEEDDDEPTWDKRPRLGDLRALRAAITEAKKELGE